MNAQPHILLIDHFDSFVNNLARYVILAEARTSVWRCNACTLTDIETLQPDGIILSPGPCSPDEAGISLSLVQHFGEQLPILGVCLGHQVIAQSYGGATIKAPAPKHGLPTKVQHNSSALFTDMPQNFEAGLYHSLAVELPKDIQATAHCTHSNTIMGLQHKTHPAYGVQFHPESILTPQGQIIIDNFIQIVKDHK